MHNNKCEKKQKKGKQIG